MAVGIRAWSRLAVVILVSSLESQLLGCAIFDSLSSNSEIQNQTKHPFIYQLNESGQVVFRVTEQSNSLWKDWRFKKQSALGGAYSRLMKERDEWKRLGEVLADELKVKLDPVEWEHACNSTVRFAAIENEVRDPETGQIFVKLYVNLQSLLSWTSSSMSASQFQEWQKQFQVILQSKVLGEKK